MMLQSAKARLKIPNRIPGISEVIKPMYGLRTLRHRKVHEEPVLARRHILDECFRGRLRQTHRQRIRLCHSNAISLNSETGKTHI